MCLAIPGKIESITLEASDMQMAVVNFGGIRRPICIDWVEASTGDYVLAHAGIALCKVDTDEAEKTIEAFDILASHAQEKHRQE